MGFTKEQQLAIDLDNTIPEVNQNTENQESVPDLNSGVVSENFDFNSSSDNMWNF